MGIEILDSRLKFFIWSIIFSFLILISGLYLCQIHHGDKYINLAYSNRLRLVRFSAPRGEIFDRNGVPLAVNETTFCIMGYPLDLDKPAKLERLSRILNKHGIPMTVNDLEKTVKQQRIAPYRVMRIVPNLTMVQMADLISDYEFPKELFPMSVWRRTYPAGNIVANVLGYVSEISEDELTTRRENGYIGGDSIGKTGIERAYEEILRGSPGQEAIEVDARGRKIKILDSSPAVKGEDVKLTLDMGAQRLAVNLLKDHKGALLAMNVHTGEVLALASSPVYDNNPLTWGVSGREWNQIINDPDRPMLDRAIAGVYPPASTFKAFMSIASLEEGTITTSTNFACHGGLRVGAHLFKCWKHSGHGSLNVIGGLQHSCDVFFYQTGLKTGIEKLTKWAKKFRFGELTGIDIPGERAGILASSEWKLRRFKSAWFNGDTVNYSIGQGYALMTPIQIARTYAAIANGGKLVTPHLNKAGYKKPENINLNPEKLAIVQKGLDYVVSRGTGSRAGRFGVSISGKTGTAQNSHGPDHALFAGYAPSENPEYVAVAVVEAGRHGSSVAAPMVGELLAHLVNHKVTN